MFILKVNGQNAASKIFIWEVTLQCQMARHIYRRIAEYARVQVARDFHSISPRPLTAVELLADCAAFMSACGVLSRCLFGKGKFAAGRSMRLRDLLGIADLPTLRSLGVRNAFEHIDERLDRLLREDPQDEIVQIHLARKPPSTRLVLKRFDPVGMRLSYLDQQLDLVACAKEIDQIHHASLKLVGKDRAQINLLP